jgi:Asp-tRNA(Asn)/Glu-tRNA(Gln) amidotransferase C subunit
LKLTETHPPLPKEELQRLGRRAALTIDDEDDDDSQLQQDLANMMQMVQQVSQVSKTLLEFENDDDDDGDIYDAVRGVTKAPLRTSASSSSSSEEEDAAQAQQVWESYLQPQTKRSRGGGHDYFVITTKTSTTSKED